MEENVGAIRIAGDRVEKRTGFTSFLNLILMPVDFDALFFVKFCSLFVHRIKKFREVYFHEAYGVEDSC